MPARVKSARPAWGLRPWFLALLLAGLMIGCAAGVPAPVGSGAPAGLGPDEGLVILDVDTDVAVAELALDRFVAAENLPKGRHLWVVRLKAGRYRWKSVELGSESGNRDRYPVRNMGVGEDTVDPRDEFEFEVVAGAINYPGSAIVRTTEYGRSAALPILFRIRNHAAMAVRRLSVSHRQLLDEMPVRYAGGRGDTFLEHWEELRRAPRASSDSSGDDS